MRAGDRLDPWPSFGATAPHQFKIVGILPLDDGLIKARPRLAATVPVGQTMSPSDHANDVEVFEAREIRGEGDIRQSVLVASEPLMRSERFFHLVEDQDHALDRNDEVFRVGAPFNYVAPALALEDVGDCFQHLLSELATLHVLMPESNAEAQDRCGSIVDIFVELLRPQLNPTMSIKILGFIPHIAIQHIVLHDIYM